ncbi:phospholipase D-like domain-containing protein [Paludibacterium purpuratum]|uniref:Phospholipase D-like protein n=1 Tax=Paludibacterium purpuratum TaxID=1144873 RepID=A0A4R7B597_9NEIS|nr:phospholipase D-like domain-containing protein [Paludibacterium purpuratum]TDR79840.1 phospholipase D-like protein [Paludibacterium purpuratum]
MGDILVPMKLSETQIAVPQLPWFLNGQDGKAPEYSPTYAHYEYLVNGEKAFAEVYDAIANAKYSVDYICWGFQPSMYFRRGANAGYKCIGDLLTELASRETDPVQVRVLGWTMELLGINLALAGGEDNTPGRGDFHKVDTETDTQYKIDKAWYHKASHNRHPNMQFRGRGFSKDERIEIEEYLRKRGRDPHVSLSSRATMALSATHHQKTVLVDYGHEGAVGFVMGHNTLDEYWDTSEHSAKNRLSSLAKDSANPRNPAIEASGRQPRQDMSAKVAGPILEHLHHNFAQAWQKETGEDLLAKRGKPTPPTAEAGMIMAQLVRTQAQHGIRDIERLYMQAANNVLDFIYIENQYFRYPPLATAIRDVAKKQLGGGREQPLYLFVVTNSSDEGMGKGTMKTEEMLYELGHADQLPSIAKEVEQKYLPQKIEDKRTELKRSQDPEKRQKLQQDIDQLGKELENAHDNDFKPEHVEIPGLKSIICTLVAPDPQNDQWMDVYVHSKIMIINDVFTTHGSANINNRSMTTDSELNIVHESNEITAKLRKELWGHHTANQGNQDDVKNCYPTWKFITANNKSYQKSISNKNKKAPMDLNHHTQPPDAPIVEFFSATNSCTDMD